jgi:hypothetical protein
VAPEAPSRRSEVSLESNTVIANIYFLLFAEVFELRRKFLADKRKPTEVEIHCQNGKSSGARDLVAGEI